MADKKISDFTAKTALDADDLLESEASGNSRKTRAAALGVASGTSFPGSPTTGDRFWRSDLGIEAYYDGTRWLSTQVFTQNINNTTGTATAATVDWQASCPYIGIYDIYVTTVTTNAGNQAATPLSNYMTGQLKKYDNTTVTNVGSPISTQSAATGNYIAYNVTVNAVVATASSIKLVFWAWTRVGTGSILGGVDFSYRLVLV